MREFVRVGQLRACPLRTVQSVACTHDHKLMHTHTWAERVCIITVLNVVLRDLVLNALLMGHWDSAVFDEQTLYDPPSQGTHPSLCKGPRPLEGHDL